MFGELYQTVVQILRDISENSSDSESVAKARGLSLAVTEFEFLIAFITCRNALRYVKPLSISLQSRSIDIYTAMDEVSHVISTVHKCRDTIDSYSNVWYQEALSLSELVDAPEPRVPRMCMRQNNRLNTTSDNPEQYYRRIVVIPLIDHLLSELESRFSPMQQRLVKGISLNYIINFPVGCYQE